MYTKTTIIVSNMGYSCIQVRIVKKYIMSHLEVKYGKIIETAISTGGCYEQKFNNSVDFGIGFFTDI